MSSSLIFVLERVYFGTLYVVASLNISTIHQAMFDKKSKYVRRCVWIKRFYTNTNFFIYLFYLFIYFLPFALWPASDSFSSENIFYVIE